MYNFQTTIVFDSAVFWPFYRKHMFPFKFCSSLKKIQQPQNSSRSKIGLFFNIFLTNIGPSNNNFAKELGSDCIFAVWCAITEVVAEKIDPRASSSQEATNLPTGQLWTNHAEVRSSDKTSYMWKCTLFLFYFNVKMGKRLKIYGCNQQERKGKRLWSCNRDRH